MEEDEKKTERERETQELDDYQRSVITACASKLQLIVEMLDELITWLPEEIKE